MHYLHARGRAELMHLALPGSVKEVRRSIGLPDVSDPEKILHAASAIPSQAQRLAQVAVPGALSLIRECEESRHADGTRTTGGSRRIEAAARILLVPQHVGWYALRSESLRLDPRGIGSARAVEPWDDITDPIIAVPLTTDEEGDFWSRRDMRAIRVMPSITPGTALSAVLHHDGNGGTLERLHYISVDHLLPAPPALVSGYAAAHRA